MFSHTNGITKFVVWKAFIKDTRKFKVTCDSVELPSGSLPSLTNSAAGQSDNKKENALKVHFFVGVSSEPGDF